MAHIRNLTVARAQTADKGVDTGDIFLQVWLAVFTFIITGAFSDKG